MGESAEDDAVDASDAEKSDEIKIGNDDASDEAESSGETEKTFDYDTGALDADAPPDEDETDFSYDFPDPAPFVAATADDLESLSDAEQSAEPDSQPSADEPSAVPATALDLEKIAEPSTSAVPVEERSTSFVPFSLPPFLRLDGSAAIAPLKTALASSASYVAGVVSRFKPRAAAEPALPPDHVVVSFSNDADDPYFKG